MIRSDVDVLVIGSGIGGLCAAGLCARAGREVLVLEAHHQPGGAAHGFQRQGYHFESGPSLWSGLGRWPSSNPLAQVLRALGQTLEVIPYRSWDVLLPEGDLRIAVGHDDFEAVVRSLRGPEVQAGTKNNLTLYLIFETFNILFVIGMLLSIFTINEC